jgi:hypothetical protein
VIVRKPWFARVLDPPSEILLEMLEPKDVAVNEAAVERFLYLQNPEVHRWLNGIETAWTMLDSDSLRGLRHEPSGTNRRSTRRCVHPAPVRYRAAGQNVGRGQAQARLARRRAEIWSIGPGRRSASNLTSPMRKSPDLRVAANALNQLRRAAETGGLKLLGLAVIRPLPVVPIPIVVPAVVPSMMVVVAVINAVPPTMRLR